MVQSVNLHAMQLAESLGIPCEGRSTDEIGTEITMLMSKRT